MRWHHYFVPRSAGQRQPDVEELIGALAVEELGAIVLSAAERHGDVERHVRSAAARARGDLTGMKATVDSALRTRRFLDYRASNEWARGAHPIVQELSSLTRGKPSAELVLLLQRAIGHVATTISHADDSNGKIGDVARELLELHACACAAGVTDSAKLAVWMVRFSCDDQDFFMVDPVRYAAALGEEGLSAYRKAIGQRTDGDRVFAVRWARERLAVLDGDVERIVELLGGELSSPHQFLAVCDAMTELGLADERLNWAMRGIGETTGWQVAKLYDHACAVHEQWDQSTVVLRLRREQHGRAASLDTYIALRGAAEMLNAWDLERDSARQALRERDLGTLVDALLHDQEADAAWSTATENPTWDPGTSRRLRLAEARERGNPKDALAAYLLVVEELLLETGRGACSQAIVVLKRACRAADHAGEVKQLKAAIADLRERHHRRPALIEMLDRAALG